MPGRLKVSNYFESGHAGREDDMCAGLGEGLGDAKADATRGASDEHSLSVET